VHATHYSTLSVSETVQDRANEILVGTYTRRTQPCVFHNL